MNHPSTIYRHRVNYLALPWESVKWALRYMQRHPQQLTFAELSSLVMIELEDRGLVECVGGSFFLTEEGRRCAL